MAPDDHDRRAIEAPFTSALLSDDDPAGYDRWLNSSSVSTPHSPEMIISWKLSRLLRVPPGNVIRSLRGQRGQDPKLVKRLENIVISNPSLRFVQDGRVRRVALVPQRERLGGSDAR